MAKHSQFFQIWMNHAQSVLVAGHVATPTGIDEERAAERGDLACLVPGFDRHPGGIGLKSGDGPALLHLGA